MENKETIGIVKGVKAMTGASGNAYFLIETSFGNLSSFDKELVGELQKFIGKSVKVTYKVTPKGFMNLKSFIAENEEVKEEKISDEEKEEKTAEARKQKNITIYTSYVKDLVIAGKPLEEAIKIVKEAIIAFS